MGVTGFPACACHYLCHSFLTGEGKTEALCLVRRIISLPVQSPWPMCRFLVENPAYIPDDTEIRFITFGSEEAGLRGSRRYVERHLDELKRLEARMLNYEIIAYPVISILNSDVNGTVRNSP